jgi:hypothetical protein
MRDAVVEATISKDVLQMQDIRKPAVMRRLFILGSNYSAQEIFLIQTQEGINAVEVKSGTNTRSHSLSHSVGRDGVN